VSETNSSANQTIINAFLLSLRETQQTSEEIHSLLITEKQQHLLHTLICQSVETYSNASRNLEPRVMSRNPNHSPVKKRQQPSHFPYIKVEIYSTGQRVVVTKRHISLPNHLVRLQHLSFCLPNRFHSISLKKKNFQFFTFLDSLNILSKNGQVLNYCKSYFMV